MKTANMLDKTSVFLDKQIIHIILIIILGFIVYSNTFDVPFHFDDEDFILTNQLVNGDFSNFTDLSKAEKLNLPINVKFSLKTRVVTYLTFWINYKLYKFNVFSYHLINIIIHILNAILVYILVIKIFQTQCFTDSILLNKDKKYIALFSSLLFVAHPVQTESITYIAQRFSSLVTFFCLLAVIFYLEFRKIDYSINLSQLNKNNINTRLFYYLASCVSVVLAMKTKENAFILPLILALCEFTFFKESNKKRFLYLLPFLLAMLIIPLSLMDANKNFLEFIDSATRTQKTSRLEYLFTEFRVIMTYIRLLFLPINQNLDYDYPFYHSLLNTQVLFSVLFIIAMFCVAIYLICKLHSKTKIEKIIAFGVIWFFITLAVESSIIPLYHVIFEHRVYLPSIGVFMAIVSGIYLIGFRFRSRRVKKSIIIGSILIIFLLGHMTYARNEVWKSDISLWSDTAKKSPNKARVHYNLGLAYASRNNTFNAIECFKVAISLNPDYIEAHNNIASAYISAGKYDMAIEHLYIAIKLKQDYAIAYYNLGLAFEGQRLFDEAIGYYQISLRLNSSNAMAHYSLGIVYKSKGLVNEAEEHFRIAKKLMNERR